MTLKEFNENILFVLYLGLGIFFTMLAAGLAIVAILYVASKLLPI